MIKISIEEVVESGICVGCGACSIATQGRIKVEQNKLGFYQANLKSISVDELSKGSKVCPFSDDSANEDQIAKDIFPTVEKHDPRVGYSLSTYAAQVIEGEDIKLSSSGGLTSWLTLKLLESGLIDGVIHVTAAQPGSVGHPLFEYIVSTTPEELRLRRKSQYYSTTLAGVVSQIRDNGKKYALVGVPCFIKAGRLLAREDLVLKPQFAFFIGLVCGHLKSSGFAELLAWQVGVEPKQLSAVDFRVKQPGKSAGDYGFGAQKLGESGLVVQPTRSLLGGNWGHAMFQLKACDYCDDIFAETADIVFGDAWLPQYSNDWRGTNVVVCRNNSIQKILITGMEKGELMLEPLSIDMAAESQSGNYRHRWDGLSLRLEDDILAGNWVPRKRIKPGSRPVTQTRRKIIRLRRALANSSHTFFEQAKEKKSLEYFLQEIRPLVESMDKEYKTSDSSIIKIIARKIKSKILNIFNKKR